ncbi:MAG: hypothetical protein GF421_11840 [Candidatus Aminicenantes bacterium]|nr:hypothetical protein [Candidatus Aminicenantes bacterium]
MKNLKLIQGADREAYWLLFVWRRLEVSCQEKAAICRSSSTAKRPPLGKPGKLLVVITIPYGSLRTFSPKTQTILKSGRERTWTR